MKLSYRKDLVNYAKQNRKKSTLQERLIWSALRNKKLLNIKFYRQKPVLDYILDFYAPELKLGVEIDDRSHDYKIDYDSTRSERLKSVGVTILRIANDDVDRDANAAIGFIKNFIECNYSEKISKLKLIVT